MATGRLAVLSNVNMNMVIRMLQKQAEVYDAEGYGNELGALLNPASSYHAFQPDITFLIMDLAELLEHDYDPQTAKERIGNWFQTLEGCLTEHGVFYVSDAYLWAVELAVLADPERKQQLESLWSAALQHDISRTDVSAVHFHNLHTCMFCKTDTFGIYRRNGSVSTKSHTENLSQAVHGVCSVHTGTGSTCRTCFVLKFCQFFF